MNRGRLSISPGALSTLQSYHWPGNVRELEHILERTVALTQEDTIDDVDLPKLQPTTQQASAISIALRGAEKVEMPSILADVEKRLVEWALAKGAGNLAKAAEMLGIPRSTLQYKISKLVLPSRSDVSTLSEYEI